MTTSISGLGSGLDIDSIVTQLMTLESASQTALKSKVSSHQSKVSVYQALNTKFSAVQTAADALNLGLDWKAKKATSSDASVTVTADSSAISGSLSFSVKSLAASQAVASYGTVASTDTVVGSGSLVLGQTGALGLRNLSGAGLANGSHTLEVTQASSGASANGTALGNSITLNGTETLTADINGVSRNFNLTAGTYTQQSLAAMIKTVSNGELDVSVNANKSLKLATTREGSASSLQITGGTGLAALGLSAGSAVNGTDGIIKVDGVANTISDIRPDGSNSTVLNGSSGTLTTSFQGGLRVGTSTVKSIDLGDGKLSTVINNINAASAGVSASAIQVAPGQYKMQLQSSQTGTAGAIGTDFSAFSGVLGNLEEITAATNATLQVGSGANSYTITSSSNTVTGVLPGVSMTLTSADPTKTVNVSVGGDGDGMATKVQAMVDAVNDALSLIKDNSKYNTTAKSGGVLLGNNTASRLQQSLMSALSEMVDGASLGAMGNIGIKLADTGKLTFDKTKFADQFAKNPEAVASLFVEGGTVGNTTLTKPGIAERVFAMSKMATNSVSGIITGAINGENKTIEDLTKQISNWDDRLATRRNTLKRQFTAMDVAVSSLRNQGNWLAGQIAGLSSNSG